MVLWVEICKRNSHKLHKCKENYYDIVRMCDVYLTFAQIKCLNYSNT